MSCRRESQNNQHHKSVYSLSQPTMLLSAQSLGKNLTLYIRRQPTTYFPSAKEVNYHISLAYKAVIS